MKTPTNVPEASPVQVQNPSNSNTSTPMSVSTHASAVASKGVAEAEEEEEGDEEDGDEEGGHAVLGLSDLKSSKGSVTLQQKKEKMQKLKNSNMNATSFSSISEKNHSLIPPQIITKVDINDDFEKEKEIEEANKFLQDLAESNRKSIDVKKKKDLEELERIKEEALQQERIKAELERKRIEEEKMKERARAEAAEKEKEKMRLELMQQIKTFEIQKLEQEQELQRQRALIEKLTAEQEALRIRLESQSRLHQDESIEKEQSIKKLLKEREELLELEKNHKDKTSNVSQNDKLNVSVEDNSTISTFDHSSVQNTPSNNMMASTVTTAYSTVSFLESATSQSRHHLSTPLSIDNPNSTPSNHHNRRRSSRGSPGTPDFGDRLYRSSSTHSVSPPGKCRSKNRCVTPSRISININEEDTDDCLDLQKKGYYSIPIPLPANNLQNIQTLILRENHLTVIQSQSLQSLSNLIELDLSRNRITKIVGNLPSTLTRLDLSYNKLQTIQGTMLCLNLQHLNISNNILKQTDDLPFNLSKLDLSGNILKEDIDLRLIALCANLQSLWIEGNPVVEILPNWRVRLISLLPNLIELDGKSLPKTRYVLEKTPESKAMKRRTTLHSSLNRNKKKALKRSQSEADKERHDAYIKRQEKIKILEENKKKTEADLLAKEIANIPKSFNDRRSRSISKAGHAVALAIASIGKSNSNPNSPIRAIAAREEATGISKTVFSPKPGSLLDVEEDLAPAESSAEKSLSPVLPQKTESPNTVSSIMQGDSVDRFAEPVREWLYQCSEKLEVGTAAITMLLDMTHSISARSLKSTDKQDGGSKEEKEEGPEDDLDYVVDEERYEEIQQKIDTAADLFSNVRCPPEVEAIIVSDAGFQEQREAVSNMSESVAAFNAVLYNARSAIRTNKKYPEVLCHAIDSTMDSMSGRLVLNCIGWTPANDNTSNIVEAGEPADTLRPSVSPNIILKSYSSASANNDEGFLNGLESIHSKDDDDTKEDTRILKNDTENAERSIFDNLKVKISEKKNGKRLSLGSSNEVDLASPSSVDSRQSDRFILSPQDAPKELTEAINDLGAYATLRSQKQQDYSVQDSFLDSARVNTVNSTNGMQSYSAANSDSVRQPEQIKPEPAELSVFDKMKLKLAAAGAVNGDSQSIRNMSIGTNKSFARVPVSDEWLPSQTKDRAALGSWMDDELGDSSQARGKDVRPNASALAGETVLPDIDDADSPFKSLALKLQAGRNSFPIRAQKSANTLINDQDTHENIRTSSPSLDTMSTSGFTAAGMPRLQNFDGEIASGDIFDRLNAKLGGARKM